jgi:hypothetical protein
MNWALLIVLGLALAKVIIFYFTRHHVRAMTMARLCPIGYTGMNADPFDCDVFYSCPSGTKMFCPVGSQFDMDSAKCISNATPDGCYDRLNRNLLL